MSQVVLLGPQFHHPTVGAALRDLDIAGPVATITAGWQEWESEDAALSRQLGGRSVPLRLYQRSERVWEADPELRAAHRSMQDDMRALHGLYAKQLEPAAQTWVDLLDAEGPDRLLQPERDAALQAIQRLDAHLLQRTGEIRADFEARNRPGERPAVRREREEVAEALTRVPTVVIEGGHVAALLNRLLLFGIPEMLTGKNLLGCAGGAMLLCRRVILYNDDPAIGRGHSEVALPGLGFAPGVVALPDASERLKLDDPRRMRRLALRLAPDRCVLLDAGGRLRWNGSEWTGLAARGVDLDGSIADWSRAA